VLGKERRRVASSPTHAALHNKLRAVWRLRAARFRGRGREMANLRMLKYPLFDTQHPVFSDSVTVPMRRSLGLQHVAMQNGVVTLWCAVDEDSSPASRTFHIAGTGHVLPQDPSYLGTVFDRQFVWHIFELLGGPNR
jgi:hypothetical protein